MYLFLGSANHLSTGIAHADDSVPVARTQETLRWSPCQWPTCHMQKFHFDLESFLSVSLSPDKAWACPFCLPFFSFQFHRTSSWVILLPQFLVPSTEALPIPLPVSRMYFFRCSQASGAFSSLDSFLTSPSFPPGTSRCTAQVFNPAPWCTNIFFALPSQNQTESQG